MPALVICKLSAVRTVICTPSVLLVLWLKHSAAASTMPAMPFSMSLIDGSLGSSAPLAAGAALLGSGIAERTGASLSGSARRVSPTP